MSSTPPPAPASGTRRRPKRPWRDNLEALGAAILMAVLLKPLVIEAYAIPTSSMQPTLMGSDEAGVFDRILVDKLRYSLVEPKRWDIVVFRYPLRQNQNYVKRLVGMPGDRLLIMGGNLYHADPDGKDATVLRKPDRIQERLWKEIYPLRRLVRNEREILGRGRYFSGQGAQWRQDGDDLVATRARGRLARLVFTNEADGGLANRIWDGYPPDIARAIRNAGAPERFEGVQDARLRFGFTPSEDVTLLRVGITIVQAGKKERRLALEVREGRGRLVVRVGGKEDETSGEFDFAIPANATTEVGFAHVDDRLVAWRNGRRLAELDVSAHKVWTRLQQGYSNGGTTGRFLGVTASLEFRGPENARISDLRIDRDLHYTPTGVEDAMPIVVPEGHYFMMGDNTLASADSRQWRAITVGRLPDDRMVDPHRHANVQKLRGNSRARDLDGPPDPDENPVPIRTHDRVVFTDDLGEVWSLRSKLSPAYGPMGEGGPINMVFQEIPDAGQPAHEWKPVEVPVRFVPREHILGRPVVGFWPIWPLGPNRVGFIR